MIFFQLTSEPFTENQSVCTLQVNNAGVLGVKLDDQILFEELIQYDVRRIVFDEDIVSLLTCHICFLASLVCLLSFSLSTLVLGFSAGRDSTEGVSQYRGHLRNGRTMPTN